MSAPVESVGGWRLLELRAYECLGLVASVSAGRIAYNDGGGPVVLPVNHVVDEGTIVVRTSPASLLARSLHEGWVSYEVDDLGSAEGTWSVLVRGRVRFLTEDEVDRLTDRPIPRADGVRPLHLRIVPRTITGRRLLPPG